nr:MAG TPA: hypothetical protein [Bacteriophage sp.]
MEYLFAYNILALQRLLINYHVENCQNKEYLFHAIYLDIQLKIKDYPRH